MNKKKAEMGVGTLIVFIAMLLVAAVAAGVLIQTAGSLQERALSTGSQAKSQISTNVRVIEVSATDGRSGNLTDFCEIVKLSPGSDSIKLDQIIFTFNTRDKTSTLKYRGVNGICEKSNSVGYNTWNEKSFGEMENFQGLRITGTGGGLIREDMWKDIEIDLDDDGINDLVRTCAADNPACDPQYNNTHLLFSLSSDGDVYVRLLNDNGSQVYLGDTGGGSSPGFSFSHLNISTYGYISGYRDEGTPDRITQLDTNIVFQIFENTVNLDEDYDDDGRDDFFAVNNTHAIFFLSAAGNISVPLNADIGTAPVSLNLNRVAIQNSSEVFGYLTMVGDTVANDLIPENATITVEPYRLGQGYFTAIYQQRGTNHVPGNLQRGDIIKMCFEAPSEILEDELVRLNFIPKIGTATLTEFVTPDVISTERVYLYP